VVSDSAQTANIEGKCERFNFGIEGFTLIELVLVVLIIAILASLAIPRYQELTARAQNGSAMADLGQLCVAEAAFLSDFQQYGRSNNASAAASHGLGVILVGPSNTAVLAGPVQFSPIGLSTGVHLVAHTSVPDGTHFGAMVKHMGGTRIFGADNAASGLYQRPGQRGQTLADAGIALAVTDMDDLAGNGWENL